MIRQPIRKTMNGAAAFAAAFLLACAAAGAAHAGKLKVAAVYTLPVEQQWIGRIHKALSAAEARGAIDYDYSENVPNADYEKTMRAYAEQGVDLMIGESFSVERAARKVAAEYPDTAILMGSSLGPQAPNFSVFDNFIHEPSYLTGIAAGAQTESNLIGMVGGYAIPEVNRLMHAFMAGARSVNPRVRFLVTFIDSWHDPAKARDSASAMIDKGADVLYAERSGVADAAAERGIPAIGNVADLSGDYPGTIIAGALWHMEPTVDKAIEAVASGSYKAEDYGKYSFMKYGGGGVALDETLIPAETVARIREVEKAILDGTFTVEIHDAEPKSTAKSAD